MDIFEKIFQKISQSETFSSKDKKTTLFLKDISKYLDVFAQSLSLNSNQNQIQVVGSRDFIGLYGGQLFLPEKIYFFNDQNLNKNLYKNLVLQIMSAHHLNIFSSSDSKSRMEQRLRFLEQSHKVNTFLDTWFPGYQVFQNELIEHVENKLKVSLLNRDSQREKYIYWHNNVCNRNVLAKSTYENSKIISIKSMVPNYLFLTVPCIEIRNIKKIKFDGNIDRGSHKNKTDKPDEEKTYASRIEKVDIEKEKSNPVMHSFEKLETADEYQGERRIDSGDDEMGDHSKALDELNLSKVTLGGEAAQSVYNSELILSYENEMDEDQAKSNNKHFYPEWSVNKGRYLPEHCHLLENPQEIAKTPNGFKEELISKNRYQIKYWQSQIQKIFSEPLWQKKLKEGDDIDIDEFIRDYSSMIMGKTTEAKWYMKRKNQFSNVEIMILFDQSYSSDSWVSNRRILDVTLESVGITGLLFEKIFEAVTVAGIWSATRFNCSFQIYKKSKEPWDEFFSKQGSIQPQGYTRLGPAIRHAIHILKQSSYKKKLILLLTDAKPTDVDGYEGTTGIADVAQASREAEMADILLYTLIFDNRQKGHFPKMFRNYKLLQDPKQLSQEIFNILLKCQGD